MNSFFKIISRSILGILALSAFTACSEDILDAPGQSDRLLLPGEYRFIISRDSDGSSPSLSRVNYETISSSRFETGDQIGVFASDRESQIQNDVFAARSLDGNTEIQVLAPPSGSVSGDLDTEIPEQDNISYIFYYPMNKDWKRGDMTKGTGFSYTVEADQSTKEGYQKSDFLWNYLHYNPSESYQMVSMHHLMASIVVKINKDSIDTSDDKGITLRNVPVTATGIKFQTQTSGSMSYTTAAKSATDIKMYLQGTSGDYLIYRAAVPAWQTLTAGSDIITCTLFDRAGNPVEVTYKLAKDLSLRDGYFYTFTLGSAAKPAVPDVTDEDSWVLDVFDPETNEVVGLLCREYLRYQPDHTGAENISAVDRITGTAYGDTKYISSQAWVFYDLKDTEKKIPDLKYGTVLRFIYDVRPAVHEYYDPNTAQAWPAPHIYGGNGSTSQGLFLAKHGHTWVKNGLYGESSKDWVENYMHGGTIVWEPVVSPEGHFYYNIGQFNMPDEKITNEKAYNYGHIAIAPDGGISVSYAKFDGEPGVGGDVVFDENGCKVAYVLEHYLVDEDDTRGIKYPLVKIGYNNFWMSKSLRRSNQSDMDLIRYNDEDDPFKEYTDDKVGNLVLEPGYLYPFYEGGNFSVFRDCPNREDFPLLYNYPAISDPKFVPESTGDIVPDDRFTCYLPTTDHVYHILNYFGWRFGAKLMTSQVITKTENDEVLETEFEALMKNKIVETGYNSYAANVSGFNFRTDGEHGYNFGMGMSFGFKCVMWIDNDYYTSTPGDMKVMQFQASQVFSSTEIAHLLTTYADINGYIGPSQKSREFVSVRFTLKMKDQEVLRPDEANKAKTSRVGRAKAPAAKATSGESRRISVPLILK